MERNNYLLQSRDDDVGSIRTELLEMMKAELCHALSRFVLEVRKTNGEDYPAETMYEIIISLQMYLESNGRVLKLLNDEEFTPLKNTLDAKMKELSAAGKRCQHKKAGIITETEEELLWSKGVLGTHTPRKLVDTMLYLLGLHFALRAGKEHRQLRFVDSQLSVEIDSKGERCLRYVEDTSKNRQGGLKHRKIEPKTVYAYPNKLCPERCILNVYEQYISHRPISEKCSNAFYLRPLMKPLDKVWFSCQPIGENELMKTVGRLCSDCGLQLRIPIQPFTERYCRIETVREAIRRTVNM